MAATLIAHRGYAGLAPENTVRAVRTATDHDVTDMVEIDVQPAACGTPVVIHDHRLDGSRNGQPLTDREGVVWETPLETVTAAEVLGSGETVPTLSTVLEAVPQSVRVNVELKTPGTLDIALGMGLEPSAVADRRERWVPFVERVVADCDAAGRDVLFSSFAPAALAAAEEVAPDYGTAPIAWGETREAIEMARHLDSEAVHPRHTAVDETVLEAAQAAGIAVNVWTLEEESEVTGPTERVDGLIADVPLSV